MIEKLVRNWPAVCWFLCFLSDVLGVLVDWTPLLSPLFANNRLVLWILIYVMLVIMGGTALYVKRASGPWTGSPTYQVVAKWILVVVLIVALVGIPIYHVWAYFCPCGLPRPFPADRFNIAIAEPGIGSSVQPSSSGKDLQQLVYDRLREEVKERYWGEKVRVNKLCLVRGDKAAGKVQDQWNADLLVWGWSPVGEPTTFKPHFVVGEDLDGTTLRAFNAVICAPEGQIFIVIPEDMLLRTTVLTSLVFGLVESAEGDHKEALSDFKEAVQQAEQRDWVKGLKVLYLLRGLAHSALGNQHYEAAELDFENSTAIDPEEDYAPGHIALGNLWYIQGDLTRAREEYEKVTEEINRRHSRAWIGIGNIAYREKRLYDAIDAYNKAIEYESELALGYCLRGAALCTLDWLKGRKGAEDYFQTCEEKAKDDSVMLQLAKDLRENCGVSITITSTVTPTGFILPITVTPTVTLTRFIPPTPSPLHEITVGVTDKLTTLDPAEAYMLHDWEILRNTYLGLVQYGPDGELVPGLATGWEVSDDGTQWTFYLRNDLQFSDGTPLTADIVKKSIDRVVKLEGEPSYLVSSFVDHVDAPDEAIVIFTLFKPTAFFLNLVTTPPYFPVHPDVLKPPTFTPPSARAPGTGPFVVTEIVEGDHLRLEANPKYIGDPPRTRVITIRYFDSATAMSTALSKGDIDIAPRGLRSEDIVDLQTVEGIQIAKERGRTIRFLAFNTSTPPFDDQRVRKAIAVAIDRDSIAKEALLGAAEPLYSMIPYGVPGHLDVYGEMNLDLAKELLGEVGYSRENPLQVDLGWTPAHYGETEADVVAVLKRSLEETGAIRVSPQSAGWATYLDYLSEGSIPVFLLGWYADIVDPDEYVRPFAYSKTSDRYGIFYSSSKMDQLLTDARLSGSLQDRDALYTQIQTLYAEEVPTVPLFQDVIFVAAREDIMGIQTWPDALFDYSKLFTE